MMRWCLVITLAVVCLNAATARPSDGVEVEKLRLVKFPEESFQYQTREQSDETRRILEEINKINVALGYVKKQDSSSPAILDSDLYLYPRPSYHPSQSSYNNGVSLPPSIRYLNAEQPMVSRKIVHHHSVMYPQIQDPEAYYYPSPYLRLPHRQESKSFQETNEDFELSSPNNLQKLMAITNDVTSIVEYAKDAGTNDGRLLNDNAQTEDDYSEKLIGNLKTLIANEANRKKAKSKAENAANSTDQTSTNAENNHPKFVLLPAKLHSFSVEKPSFTKPGKLDKQRTNTKVKVVPTPKIDELERGPFGLLRPRPTQPPKSPSTTQIHKVPLSSASYDAMDDGDAGTEKYFFLANRRDQSVNKEALKEGGIIIQRLKVRKGGIAIAGPGGVATAGSGGTAIVGPGGLAFTHPRSLTIAGPGARVVALPESYDLEKAIAKAKGRNIPQEGRLVATGPTVYYHPDML